MGPGGLDALVTLGAGDMRRSLNILQSAHMAFDEVDADAVYLCTGHPLPRDIEAVVTWLLNEEFNDAFDRERGGAGNEASRRRRGPRRGRAGAPPSPLGLGLSSPCRAVHPSSTRAPRPCRCALVPAGILQLQVDKGIAVADIVRELHP